MVMLYLRSNNGSTSPVKKANHYRWSIVTLLILFTTMACFRHQPTLHSAIPYMSQTPTLHIAPPLRVAPTSLDILQERYSTYRLTPRQMAYPLSLMTLLYLLTTRSILTAGEFHPNKCVLLILIYRKIFRELTFTADSRISLGNNSSIHQSDIALFGTSSAIWINGTQPQPALINPDNTAITLPDIEFPFARLASVTLADQSATFLYHQINGTTFAEEQWDNIMNAWLPSVYIIVSDS